MGEPDGQFDGHAHVFEASARMVDNPRYRPNQDALRSTYFDLLQSAGLDGGILVQPSFLGTDNSYLLDTIAATPEASPLRLRGVIALAPGATHDEIAALSRAGIIGVRLNLYGSGPDFRFDIDVWKGLLRRVSDFNWHVGLHCEGARLAHVLPVVLSHADRVVVDHFGLPDPDALTNCAGQRAILNAPADRLFVKASSPYRVFRKENSEISARRCAPLLARLFDALGPERMLWGSDWPWTQFEDRHDYFATLAWQDLWLCDVEDRIRSPEPSFGNSKIDRDARHSR